MDVVGVALEPVVGSEDSRILVPVHTDPGLEVVVEHDDVVMEVDVGALSLAKFVARPPVRPQDHEGPDDVVLDPVAVVLDVLGRAVQDPGALGVPVRPVVADRVVADRGVEARLVLETVSGVILQHVFLDQDVVVVPVEPQAIPVVVVAPVVSEHDVVRVQDLHASLMVATGRGAGVQIVVVVELVSLNGEVANTCRGHPDNAVLVNVIVPDHVATAAVDSDPLEVHISDVRALDCPVLHLDGEDAVVRELLDGSSSDCHIACGRGDGHSGHRGLHGVTGWVSGDVHLVPGLVEVRLARTERVKARHMIKGPAVHVEVLVDAGSGVGTAHCGIGQSRHAATEVLGLPADDPVAALTRPPLQDLRA